VIDGKVISVRMPDELAGQIDAMARAEGVSVSEAMRAAAYRYIATRKADQDFKDRLRKRLEEDAEILKRLAE
jgi:metal-responsive CopG/Arc/MetJ family transcriptional regulator